MLDVVEQIESQQINQWMALTTGIYHLIATMMDAPYRKESYHRIGQYHYQYVIHQNWMHRDKSGGDHCENEQQIKANEYTIAATTMRQAKPLNHKRKNTTA